MIKAIIRNNGKLLDEQQGSDLESLQAWLAPFEKSGVYGKSAHSIQQLVSEAEEDLPAVYETIEIPAEYEIEYVDMDLAPLSQAEVNEQALKFLLESDYKVLKHRDQVDMGISPDLSVEEYQYLLAQRQQARDSIIS